MALTLQQEAFAQRYVETRDPAGSYQFAYNVSPDAAQTTHRVEASRLLSHPNVSRRIAELTAASSQPVTLTIARIIERFGAIATADPNELIGLRVGCCRRCYGDDHRFQWDEGDYLDALGKADKAGTYLPDIAGGFGWNHTLTPVPACPGCRGEGVERVVARDTTKLSPGALALYGGVKKTRNGIEIIMADQQKALENVARIAGIYQDKVRLDGSLTQMAASVQLEATDPNEAARIYMDMVKTIRTK